MDLKSRGDASHLCAPSLQICCSESVVAVGRAAVFKGRDRLSQDFASPLRVMSTKALGYWHVRHNGRRVRGEQRERPERTEGRRVRRKRRLNRTICIDGNLWPQAGCNSRALTNSAELDTQPKRSSTTRREASWLLLGKSCPIGSLMQSSSNTHK
jgi:hypothetical protein